MNDELYFASRCRDEDIVYYAYDGHDGRTRIARDYLSPTLMTGDYPLFETEEDCISYWASQGVIIDRPC